MEYGLRRYEASERLLWLLFFVTCILIAYWSYSGAPSSQLPGLPMPRSFQPEVLKSPDFWLKFRWIKAEPFGSFIVFLASIAGLFLGGRLIGLLIQLAGKSLVAGYLKEYAEGVRQQPPTSVKGTAARQGFLVRAEELSKKSKNVFFLLLFHPFRRLRVMLSSLDGTFSSEGLAEKERRIAETDWEILWGSWTPFRWIVRLLPLVGLAETVWLIHQYMQPALSGQRELSDLVGPVFTALFPLLQVIVLCLFFSLAGGILKRLEGLYLSSLDALFYDQLIVKVPFQNTDTMMILEMLQRNFEELRSALNRLETLVNAERNPRGK